MTTESATGVSNTVRGGIQYGPVLQGGQFINPTFVTQQSTAPQLALAQLPPPVTGFIGRDAELAQIARLLNPSGEPGAVVVTAVAGLAGVGKTALTVHAAHAAWEAGWFPGGVLFIDLHGYKQMPLKPGQALDALLRALGVAGERIPDDLEQRAGLYRSALAQISEPLLIVADNASAEIQVRPLLPGPGPHRVIVTSRHTLAGLGARLLDVAVLDQTAAVQLLDRVLRAARPDDDRIGGSREAAGRLAEVCGGLPLALQIIAALLAADPALAAGEMADALADEVGRLEALRYDDGSGTSAPSVAAAFDLSYQQLDADAARLFRLLSSHPGADVSLGSAAALAAWTPTRTRTVLGHLTKAHLVETGGGSTGRWRMHDLLRHYSRGLSGADPGMRDQATDRLLAHYLKRVGAANDHLRMSAQPTSAEFTSREDAVAWLDSERPNLIAAVTTAAATGRHAIAATLPLQLSGYLSWRRQFDDWLTVLVISRDSALFLGDRLNEAAALNNLGLALAGVRRFEEAISAHRDAAAIFREMGNRRHEGGALGNLSVALVELRRFEEAISASRDAAAIFRETDDQHGEGKALNNLGLALRETRQFEQAISAHRDAAAIFRETDDRHSEGTALDNLGAALQGIWRFEEAISAHRDAAAIFRQTNDRHSEARVLNNLGAALKEVRRSEEAITAHRGAVAIYKETGDQHGEGTALTNLGLALAGVRRFEEAITAHRGAVAIYRETGDQHGEGTALTNLGLALAGLQRLEEAINAQRDAAAIFRQTNDRHSEGTALNHLGAALAEGRKFHEANRVAREATALFHDTGDRNGEGMALANLGHALAGLQRFEEAIAASRDAVATFRATVDRHSEGIALINLGSALAQMHRFEQAISAYQDAVAIFQATADRYLEGIARMNLDLVRGISTAQRGKQ